MSVRTTFVRISSKDRIISKSSSKSNFTVQLEEKYYTQGVRAMQVHSCQVPNNFYNVGNEMANLTFNIIQTGQPITAVTIAEGQYTVSTYIAALKTAMDAKLVGGTTVTITQNPINQRLTFTFAGGVNTVSLVYSDATNGAFETMGFDPVTISAATSWAAGNIPNLRGIPQVYIHSREINGGNYIDGNRGSISCFAQVSFHDVPFGAMGNYTTRAEDLDVLNYSRPRNFSTIRIVLRDSEGNILDIGTAGDIVIVLKILYV